MVAYFTIAFIAVLLALIPTNKKFGLNCAFLVITIFLAIRYKWGNDYVAYMEMYQDFNSANFDLFDIEKSGALRGGKEYGWVILNRLFGTLHLGFFGMIIALTIFENWVIRRIIIRFAEPKYYWVAVTIYVLSTSFLIDASMMRQYLCICLYLLVVEIMILKKTRGYLFISIGLIFLGTTFHLSNIAMLISLPIFYIHFKPKGKSYIWMAGIGITIFLWNIFSYNFLDSTIINLMMMDESLRGYAAYMHEETNGADSGLGVIFRYSKLLVLLWLIPKITEKHKQTFFLLIVFSYFFEAVSMVVPTAGRFIGYFAIMNMLLWSYIFQMARRHPWLYVLIFGQILIMHRELVGFLASPTWHDHFIEFHTIYEVSQWM